MVSITSDIVSNDKPPGLQISYNISLKSPKGAYFVIVSISRDLIRSRSLRLFFVYFWFSLSISYRCLFPEITLWYTSEWASTSGPDPDLKSDRCSIDYKTTNLNAERRRLEVWLWGPGHDPPPRKFCFDKYPELHFSAFWRVNFRPDNAFLKYIKQSFTHRHMGLYFESPVVIDLIGKTSNNNKNIHSRSRLFHFYRYIIKYRPSRRI